MAKRKSVTRNDLSAYHGEVLRITWEDISGYDEVTSREMASDKPLIFQTYGLCIGETAKAFHVCCNMPIDRKDAGLRDALRIPKRSIDSIDILGVINESTKSI